MTDDELLVNFSAGCAGDQQAWQRLFDYTLGLVRSWQSRAGFPVAYCQVVDVEDICNDAWMNFWRFAHSKKFPSGAKMLAYLQRCVRSAVIEEGRRYTRMPVSYDLPSDLQISDDTLDRLIALEWFEKQFSGIDRSIAKDALTGVPPRETAGRLGIPVHRVYKARSAFRRGTRS